MDIFLITESRMLKQAMGHTPVIIQKQTRTKSNLFAQHGMQSSLMVPAGLPVYYF